MTEEQKEKRREYDRKWREKNREKVNEYKKKWNENNKEKRRESDRKRYQNNKEKIGQANKKWKENNKEKRRESDRKWSKLKRDTDPLFKLTRNLRSSISRAIARNGCKKTSKTMEILGVDYDTFKQYIENQFESWMNWDNYGKYIRGTFNYGWDIDHIIPCSSATTEEEIIKLNHYTNLRPLCSKINRDVKRGNIIAHHT